MALIKCDECGKEVSDKAATCPNCGAPIASKQNSNTQPTIKITPVGSDSKNKTKTSNDSVIVESPSMFCPKCGNKNISYQRELTGSIGASTNRVVIQQPKVSHGCLYWIMIGWWLKPIYWLCFGWWWGLLFGGKARGGLNFHADKTLNRTTAVCQNCGYSWKV